MQRFIKGGVQNKYEIDYAAWWFKTSAPKLLNESKKLLGSKGRDITWPRYQAHMEYMENPQRFGSSMRKLVKNQTNVRNKY